MPQTLFRYRAILFLALACLIAGCTGSTNPPAGTYDRFVAANGTMFGFDASHTHFNSYEHILNPANIARLAPAWTYPAVGIIASTPAIVNGVVYAGSDDKSLYALDARSGSKLWSFATGGAIFSTPAVVNGIVYIGSGDDSLYALDARSGSKLWSFATKGIIFISTPAVANGIVYVGSDDKSLYALDAHSGSKLWSFATGGFITSLPAIADGVVYVGSWDGKVYAFRLPG